MNMVFIPKGYKCVYANQGYSHMDSLNVTIHLKFAANNISNRENI